MIQRPALEALDESVNFVVGSTTLERQRARVRAGRTAARKTYIFREASTQPLYTLHSQPSTQTLYSTQTTPTLCARGSVGAHPWRVSHSAEWLSGSTKPKVEPHQFVLTQTQFLILKQPLIKVKRCPQNLINSSDANSHTCCEQLPGHKACNPKP